jgi:hypothetical protein
MAISTQAMTSEQIPEYLKMVVQEHVVVLDPDCSGADPDRYHWLRPPAEIAT